MTDQTTTTLMEERCPDERVALKIRRAHKETAKLRKRIYAAVLAEEPSRFRGLVRVTLSSFHCKLTALTFANRKLDAQDRVAPETLLEIAKRLDPWTPSREDVRMWSERKRSGGFRQIMSFGLENRAKQILVRWTLQAWIQARLSPRQHVFNGGRPAAVRATSAMIEEGGHKYAVELDISDCFGSISIEWLKANIPLPSQVIDAVCSAEQLSIVAMDQVALSHLQSCRRGLPQGSAVSSLLAEYAVASALEAVPSGIAFQTYVDNVFCSARSQEELRRYYMTLQRCFAAHPSGSFAVRASSIQMTTDGFSVLGYTIRRKWRKAVIRVSDNRHESFASRVEALWERSDLEKGERKRLAYRLITSWCGAHSLWWGVRKMERQLRSHIRYLVPCTYDPVAATAAHPTY